MYVLGTAGHVDHGKSTLIERLTGIDPDRLAEEKERGLTIDLGFAWMTLPSGTEVGIVDVPGHERFVGNMLAGAGSIDAALFVVAANEGWKPQSEEHLAILDLLGVRGAVVALTKSDLVSEGELRTVADAVAGRLDGTALEGAPIVPVSTPADDGIDELIEAIDAMLRETPRAPDRDRPRLFVDRAFSIKGAGTVVTGTLTGGTLRVDDEAEILPSGGRARIRSIQTHKRQRDAAEPGSRVALNLAGIDRDEILRGDAVVRPGAWRPTNVLDVAARRVRDIAHRVGSRGAYKLHLGSAEIDARMRILGADQIAVDGRTFARLTLSEPVVADSFDRFVLRDSGRQTTVAGGVVLDPHPAARRLTARDVGRRVAELEARQRGGRDGLLANVVAERGAVAAADLAWLAGGVPADNRLGAFAASDAWLASATEMLVAALRTYHDANPLARGMPRDEARPATGIADPKLFSAVVDATADVVAEGTLLRLATHRVAFSGDQEIARSALLAELDTAALAPPPLKDLAEKHGTALVDALVDAGDIVRITPELAFARTRYEQAREAMAQAIREEGPLTASRLRDVLGTSRKYLIPLLEHLDAAGFTKRNGDVRDLTEPA